MYDRRMQLLLDEGRYQRIAREAERRGVSKAIVIREAIDGMCLGPEARRVAVNAILSADTMSVPIDPSDLRRELDAARARHVG